MDNIKDKLFQELMVDQDLETLKNLTVEEFIRKQYSKQILEIENLNKQKINDLKIEKEKVKLELESSK
ncbi:hypothetical protein DLAC_02487 [Tieghemostelium lacteum]|uniref:Uncharacterized protein n=1 Tax=Tieghemostelium lacteum TaxID=361077 RepID=A0A152A361_TIELA|nr:hypothetical protein DLAC_02487 [Tieghemostelium lacteum]|eukprot:KYR00481.1 hypothetical protein DLAC_02487 [Tieghemostelium lacteum]